MQFWFEIKCWWSRLSCHNSVTLFKSNLTLRKLSHLNSNIISSCSIDQWVDPLRRRRGLRRDRRRRHQPRHGGRGRERGGQGHGRHRVRHVRPGGPHLEWWEPLIGNLIIWILSLIWFILNFEKNIFKSANLPSVNKHLNCLLFR